jgi:demethylmenaquinone methyltransferase/2-methoxy-6-polyprenyl-1,4-benzoquinol methylase
MSRDPENPAPGGEPEATASFGFRDVPETEKATLVRAVFDNVAPKYDLMNDLMSVGIHRLWKREMVEQLRPRADKMLLDVGGGTGDIAFRFRDRGGGPVVVCDINSDMLEVGRDRAIDGNHMAGVDWVCGDAENLPVADSSVDAYSIAFCMRNVTRIDAALEEARRVLKPGGYFLCLEFSKVGLPLLQRIYDIYSFNVLPWLGANVAGDRDAYVYLAESIRRFPDQESYAKRIAAAGFEHVKVRNLSGGIAALHGAWRL